LRTRAFWALFFAYLCTPLAVFSIVTHSVAFAVDHGFPRLFVASIFGLTGLLSVVGRIVFGVAADRIGRATSATISYGCTALGTLCLLGLEVWPHAAALYAYALLFGLGFGARGPIITAMAAQLFPGPRFGVIYGILSVGNGIGGGVAPWFGGFVHDLTGSYRLAFMIAVAFCVIGSVCFWLARPPRRTL
jgi:MFS family permease